MTSKELFDRMMRLCISRWEVEAVEADVAGLATLAAVIRTWIATATPALSA